MLKFERRNKLTIPKILNFLSLTKSKFQDPPYCLRFEMEAPENNSVLSVNNSFYKIYKTLKEKKRKNESIVKETEWIQSQLLSGNPKICENAVNLLILCSGSSEIEVGFALSSIISSLPRLLDGTYEILTDGLIKLLLLDLDSPDYSCPFGIQYKPHPMLLLIDESPDKMLFLSQKIVRILKR